MKVLIVAGGTGGHVYPAVAIGECFKKHIQEVIFVGRKSSFEEQKYDNYGFKQYSIIASQFNLDLKSTFLFIINFIRGVFESFKIIKNEKPNAIIGLGGYVSAPVVFAAIIMRIKLFLHEQNIVPGRTNRIFSKFAEKVFLGFPDENNFFREKGIFTGNPLREIIKTKEESKALYFFNFDNHRPTLLVFGGSGGSNRLNIVFSKIAEEILNLVDINIIFITGEKFYDKIVQEFPQDHRLKVFSYLEEMNLAYSISDLAVTRGGAMTLSELSFFGIPSVIIPFPFARDNHQLKNAQYLEKRGCLEIIEEKELTEEKLKNSVVYYFKHHDIIKKKSLSCINAFPWDSAELIYTEVSKSIR